MSRMIIQYPENKISAEDALSLVTKVLQHGRISGKNTQFCYVTVFNHHPGVPAVYAGRTRTGTDTFTVIFN